MSYEKTFNSLSKEGSSRAPYIRATDAYANKGFNVSFLHTPSGRSVFFKAFITAYNETYKSDWEEAQVIGRADGLPMFKGTSRSISMAITVPAATRSEALQNLSRVQALIQFLYPSYQDMTNALTVNQSPLIRLRVMNLLTKCDAIQQYSDIFGSSATGLSADPRQGALGVIKNVTVNHNLENLDAGVIEVADGSKVLPKLIDINFDFQVIHEYVLGWEDFQWQELASDTTTEEAAGFAGESDASTGETTPIYARDVIQYKQLRFGVDSYGNDLRAYPYQLSPSIQLQAPVTVVPPEDRNAESLDLDASFESFAFGESSDFSEESSWEDEAYLYEDDGEVWMESSSDCAEADASDLLFTADMASDAYLDDVSYATDADWASSLYDDTMYGDWTVSADVTEATMLPGFEAYSGVGFSMAEE